jgi:hypothetical protein
MVNTSDSLMPTILPVHGRSVHPERWTYPTPISMVTSPPLTSTWITKRNKSEVLPRFRYSHRSRWRTVLSTRCFARRTKFHRKPHPYWRVFQWNDYHYAIGMLGVFYRSKNGVQDFEQGPILFTPNMRHSAVVIRGDQLWIYYTDVEDSPERIKLTTIDLSQDWMNWKTAEPIGILSPEYPWEGANEPVEPSSRGLIHSAENQLRDPAIFTEDGKTCLFYSIAVESGIPIAELS